MKTRQKTVLTALSFAFLFFLIVALPAPANPGIRTQNVVVRARPQPLSLKMLAHVVRYCEKHDEPMHPGIIRWASASLATDDNQLVQADREVATRLFWSQ